METAIKFLQNPNVVNTPLPQKQKFLQRKGLTDQEIQLACEKSGAYNYYEVQSQILPPPVSIISNLPRYNSQVQLSFFDKIREVVHNIAIFSIVAYVLQKLYQVISFKLLPYEQLIKHCFRDILLHSCLERKNH